MSKYLCFGIAKQIVASTMGNWVNFKPEEIINEFFKTVDRNLYNVVISEEGDYVCFQLKNEFLAKYGIEIIMEQYKKFIKPKKLSDVMEFFGNANSKSDKEKLELINSENCPWLYKFELGWYGLDASAFFEVGVDAYITELVAYHISEKTFMEVYNEFLRYSRNLLINSTDNPLRTALTVAI